MEPGKEFDPGTAVKIDCDKFREISIKVRDEMPSATAFWYLTLYDAINGCLIPNEQKIYSVGENAGIKLNDGRGIGIYIAAENPASIPDEIWLPIEQKVLEMNIILRVYGPDLEKMKTWKPPVAGKL